MNKSKISFNRSAGVLMNISSLPSEFGIGCFTQDADMFADMVADMGFHWWQILPITVIGWGNSPYSGLSTHAGNYLYISPVELERKGLLTAEDLDNAKYRGAPFSADYDFAKENISRVLTLAYSRISDDYRKGMAEFAKKESYWLDDYALYMALAAERGTAWWNWEDGLARRDESALSSARKQYRQQIDFYVFEQYEFYSQWSALKKRINARGVKIIGDLPFYVATDSVDVWANAKDFQLDEKFQPTAIAGVPPDAFAEKGQVWGNCLYDFAEMKKNGFGWWRARIKHCLEMYDALRLDHFRAFHSYFSIPSTDKDTAEHGHWIKWNGEELLDLLVLDNPDALFIAEDLGDIDQDCREFIDNTEMPTMRVFQFGFDGTPSVHLTYNYGKNNIAYTATHDNNTTLGWLYDINADARDFALKFCGFNGAGWGAGGPSCESTKAIIRTVISSSAVLAVIPVQDLLGYGGDTRMNTPGVAEGNWRFRLAYEFMNTVDRDFFLGINNTYGRNNAPVKDN